MPPQEEDSFPWVVRTDFTDEKAWLVVKDLISAPNKEHGEEFFAYVKFISDEAHRDKTPHEIVLSLPNNYSGMHFCFMVDRASLEHPNHPVIVVGFYPSDDEFERPPRETHPGDVRTFRALPSQIQGIENNLSIANMDFEDFADGVDQDGVFRGFR